jgi:ApaG protein
MASTAFFYRLSHGMRITVRPEFLPAKSEAGGRSVFAYHIRIENVGDQAAQLVTRRWLIHDSVGEDSVVEGEGVIGEQPVIQPGRVHEYSSFCVLRSRHGWMEGSYHFIRADGTEFDAAIPRFHLDAPEP